MTNVIVFLYATTTRFVLKKLLIGYTQSLCQSKLSSTNNSSVVLVYNFVFKTTTTIIKVIKPSTMLIKIQFVFSWYRAGSSKRRRYMIFSNQVCARKSLQFHYKAFFENWCKTKGVFIFLANYLPFNHLCGNFVWFVDTFTLLLISISWMKMESNHQHHQGQPSSKSLVIAISSSLWGTLRYIDLAYKMPHSKISVFKIYRLTSESINLNYLVSVNYCITQIAWCFRAGCQCVALCCISWWGYCYTLIRGYEQKKQQK